MLYEMGWDGAGEMEGEEITDVKIESCSQDSPPAAGRFSDILPFRRSAIPRSAFLYSR